MSFQEIWHQYSHRDLCGWTTSGNVNGNNSPVLVNMDQLAVSLLENRPQLTAGVRATISTLLPGATPKEEGQVQWGRGKSDARSDENGTSPIGGEFST